MSNYIFVDVEALGTSPVNGTMTEFGAVHGTSKKMFHGVLFEGTPNPENPAVPVIGKRLKSDMEVATEFLVWLSEVCGNDRPVFVSDNPAYDWMWIAGMFDRAEIDNPFGHSGRRISDFWAGLNQNFGETQSWKTFRQTPHDHNPVNDAMGNVEAFEIIKKIAETDRNREKRRIKEIYKDYPSFTGRKSYYKVVVAFGTHEVGDIFSSYVQYYRYMKKGRGSSIIADSIDLETSKWVEKL